ncbi:MAG: FecR family protein [Bacteroidota bacterium]
MNKDNRNNKSLKDPEASSKAYFSGAYIPWEKSKDEVWDDLLVRLQKEGQKQGDDRRFLPGWRWLAAAASLTLLLAVTGYMRFHLRECYCPAGQHTSLELPDGSLVELNAETSIRYHPFWWFKSREVQLQGEAFFNVKPGKKFNVVSSMASTEVKGTTFNIFSRDLQYRVICLSGLVQITSARTRDQIILAPNECANLNTSGVFDISPLNEEQSAPGWMNKLIMFSSAPLKLVVDEIERQYGIEIELPPGMNQLYSGNLSLNQPVNNVLYLLCRPFDLDYEQKTGKKFIIHPALKE